ncbi:early protein [Human papillomavirus 9]|uniref:Protein E6 n=2 Tax=Human papillomavirus 9 TaxID=10621 RepID=VE6_HPV09|nr:early protein [Human papillomavirus 9]P36801.1 RecName: Full=Protein E6 [Human papillomavirus 9]CAA52482.1 early protein [Human papillomavirus 9]
MYLTEQIMDRPKPRTVKELADTLVIPLIDLLIPCKFCNRFLSYFELLNFDHKCLQLIWTEEDLVYGLCSSCAYASAQLEFTHFFQFAVVGKDIETVEGTAIGNICIRCRYCFKLLDLVEKLATCYKFEQFYKVRNSWKGLCRHCGSVE